MHDQLQYGIECISVASVVVYARRSKHNSKVIGSIDYADRKSERGTQMRICSCLRLRMYALRN